MTTEKTIVETWNEGKKSYLICEHVCTRQINHFKLGFCFCFWILLLIYFAISFKLTFGMSYTPIVIYYFLESLTHYQYSKYLCIDFLWLSSNKYWLYGVHSVVKLMKLFQLRKLCCFHSFFAIPCHLLQSSYFQVACHVM